MKKIKYILIILFCLTILYPFYKNYKIYRIKQEIKDIYDRARITCLYSNITYYPDGLDNPPAKYLFLSGKKERLFELNKRLKKLEHNYAPSR